MADKYCSACERLKEDNLDVLEYGISEKECKSLQKDTGLNPDLKVLHTDCEDLNDMNDCLIGQLGDRIPAEDDCEWKPFATRLMGNLWNVLKGIICAICGLWNVVHCLDAKTQQSVRTVKLWTGNVNAFDLPSMTISEPLDSFDYLDLHLLFGTEHVVGRISLEGGLGGVPTTVIMDKIAANTSYKIAPGAMAMKEIGLKFPNQKTVAVDHFIWSISGSSTMSLDTVNSGVFVAFSNTSKTKAYNDAQDIAGDKPHKILMIEGIISGETGSCI